MKKRFGRSICAVGVLCVMSCSVSHAEEFVEKKFQFWWSHTQEHLWLSAAGTFVGTQIFHYVGVPKRPAVALSALGILGVGVAKEFAYDPHPGINSLEADALGVLLGSVLSLSIRFDPHVGYDPTWGAEPRTAKPASPSNYEDKL